jgi:hypothetical protein
MAEDVSSLGWLRWTAGRQQTGYQKMLLAGARWPLPFDLYLLRYRVGSEIPPHVDPVTERRHFRVNIVLREADSGGQFKCLSPIFESRRIKVFRSDVSEHSVSKIDSGMRLDLSFGWTLRNAETPPPSEC